MKLLGSPGLLGLFAGLALMSINAARGDIIFVTNAGNGTVGEYTTSGATVNASLISGLSIPQGIAVSGSDLFVANDGTGTIGEYTTSGATVNASLISGLSAPCPSRCLDRICLSRNAIGGPDDTIGEYTTSGATVNASLISGLSLPDRHRGVWIESVCREL